MRTLLLLTCVLLAGVALADGPATGACLEDDAFVLTPRTNGLLITHSNATYNCCPDPITYEIEQNGQQILVVERVLSEAPCDCICCFELQVELMHVPPGNVTVTFSWYDEETGQTPSVLLTAFVPGGAVTDPTDVQASQRSDCLPTGTDRCEWGVIKADYR
jgi:hypothetical protein